MKWRLLLTVSVLGLATFACGGPYISPEGAKESDVTKYANDYLYPWLKKLGNAVCQLEEKNPTGLDAAKRACPPGGGTPDPPKYPPP